VLGDFFQDLSPIAGTAEVKPRWVPAERSMPASDNDGFRHSFGIGSSQEANSPQELSRKSN
jgi:hypothetical protein